MTFIGPMHHNKPNFTYLLGLNPSTQYVYICMMHSRYCTAIDMYIQGVLCVCVCAANGSLP